MMEWHVNVRKIRRYLALFMALVMMFTIVPNETFISLANQEGNGTQAVSDNVSDNNNGSTSDNNNEGEPGGNEPGGNEPEGNVPELKFESDTFTVTYGTTDACYKATYVSDGDTFEANEYKSSNETVATVDSDGQLTLHKAGETEISATVSNVAEFEDVWASYTLEVLKADLPALEWENPNSNTTIRTPWKTPFTNKVVDEVNLNGEVKYSIVEMSSTISSYKEGDIVAIIDDKSGKVTMKMPGTIKVQAELEIAEIDREKYNTVAPIYYTLIGERDEQGRLEWEKKESPYTIPWNEPFTNTAWNDPSTGFNVVYEIIEATPGVSSYEEGDIVAEVNASTGEVTMHMPGTVIVQASKAGGELYNDAEAEYTLTGNPAELEDLTWEKEIPNSIPWNETFTNVVTSDTLAGAPVVYSIKEPEKDGVIASVDSTSGEVTMYKPGQVTIVATQMGGEYYSNDQEASYVLNIAKVEPQFVEQGPITMDIGDTKTFALLGTPKTYSYNINGNRTIADVNWQTGEVKAKSEGTIILDADVQEDELVKGGHAYLEIQVVKKDRETPLEFEPPTIQKIVTYDENPRNRKFTLTAKGDPGLRVRYRSENTSVAEVNMWGEVTILKPGTATITAYINGDDRFAEQTVSYELIVNKMAQEVSFYERTDDKFVQVGVTYENVATAKGTDTKISYISSDEEIATVNNEGKVTTHKAGRVTITATATSEYYEDASASYDIIVGGYFETTEVRVTFNENNNEYKNTTGSGLEGYVYEVKAVDDGSSLLPSKVASVDPQSGEVKINGAGTVIIRAYLPGNSTEEEVSAEYKLIVYRADQAIEFFPVAEDDKYSLEVGEVLAENPVAKEVGDKYGKGAITYSVKTDENGIVESVDSTTGELTLTGKAGTATIKAQKEQDSNYNPCEKTYTLVINHAEQNIVFEKGTENLPDISCGDSFQNVASVVDTTYESSEIVYSSSDESIAKVDSEGKLEVLSSGEVTITATSEQGDYYKEASASYTIKIIKADSEVAFELTPEEGKDVIEVTLNENNNEFINVATAYNMSGESIGECIYSVVENTDKVTVDSDGKVTINGAGTFTIKATYESALYNESSATYKLQINKADQTISFEQDVYEIYVGEEFTRPLADVTEGTQGGTGKITYTLVTDGDAVSGSIVNFEGRENDYTLELKNKPGVVGIQATKEACDDYNGATTSYTLNVIRNVQGLGPDNKIAEIICQEGYHVGAVLTNQDYPSHPIRYKLADGSDSSVAEVNAETGELTIHKDGTVIVRASVSQNDYYEEASADYTIIIGKATPEITLEQQPADGKAIEITYNHNCDDDDPNNDNIFVNAATPMLGGEAIVSNKLAEPTYAFRIVEDPHPDSQVPIIDIEANTGKVTINRAGTVEITVTYAENDWYNEASATYQLKISKANQKIAFPIDGGYEYVYDEAQSKANGMPVFILTAGRDFEDLKDNNGLSLGLEDPKAKPVGDYYGIQEIKYSYSESASNNEGVTVVKSFVSAGDAAGDIEFTYYAGSVTVTATKAEDECYNSANAKYKIYYWAKKKETLSETPYKLQGTEAIEGSGWYKGNVSIVAQEGFLLSYNKYNDGDSTKWKPVLENAVTETGENSIVFFVKDNDGNIYSKFTEDVEGDTSITIKVDNIAPSANIELKAKNSSNEEVVINAWDKKLTIIDKNEYPYGAQLIINAWDEQSGLEHPNHPNPIQYYIEYVTEDQSDITLKSATELDAIDAREWVTYSANSPVTIPSGAAFIAYAKVTDVAGNHQYASTNGIIHEGTAPVISYAINENPASDGYYTKDVTIDVSAVDQFVYSGIKKVEYAISYIEDGVLHGGNFNTLYDFDEANSENPEVITNPGYPDLLSAWSTDKSDDIVVSVDEYNYDDVRVTIKATDHAGNVGEEEIPLKLCNAIFEMDVIYDTNGATVQNTLDGVDYFKTDREIKLQITRRTSRFVPDDVILNITNAAGNSVNAWNKSEWVTVENEQNQDATTHTLTITFTGDTLYNCHFSYKDEADNETIAPFVVDKTAPNASAVIGNDTWYADGQSLATNSPATIDFVRSFNSLVNISAQNGDLTSPMKPFEYYISNCRSSEKLNPETITEWQAYNGAFDLGQDNAYFTLYFKAVDYANNVTYFNSNGYVVDYKASDIDAKAQNAPVANGYYNNNIPVRIFVDEVAVDSTVPYSGVKTVTYWVTCDGVVTQTGTYDYTTTNPNYTQVSLVKNWYTDIVIQADKNNSDNVKLIVETVDNAGNGRTAEYSYKIDYTAPRMTLDYSPKAGNHVESMNRGYFGGNRTATITITERNSTFNGDVALNTILSGITATDSNGNAVQLNWDKSQMVWKHTEGATPDEATHSIQIVFAQDANYSIDSSAIRYTDMAMNLCQGVEVVTGVQDPYSFTIDKVAPEARVYLEGRTWSTLLDVLTFNCSNRNVQTTVSSSKDATSPYDIYYYVTDQVTPISLNALMSMPQSVWSKYTQPVSVTENKYCVVYFKVVDYAGNTTYLNADGYISDKVVSEIKLTPDKTEIQHNGVGVYNKDVEVLVEVTEPDDYSGIATVEYWVTCDGKETQRETLYDYKVDGPQLADGTFPQQNELTKYFAEKIKVLSALNNSCNVAVTVRTKDNAGNVNQMTQKLDIDITAPVIEITYDNNDLKKEAEGREYYNKDRTATVVITERTGHFNGQKATDGIVVTTNDIENFKDIDIINGWTTRENANDANAATHTAAIIYATDANYTFQMAYTDLAGNSNIKTDAAKGTKAPYQFTVDKKAPTGTLQISNLGTWDDLVGDLTFGLTSTVTVKISGTTEDEISPIESILYYKSDKDRALTLYELEQITEWTTFTEFSVSPVEKFAVYKKVTDYAGNVSYISTNGVILDDRAAQIVISTPNTASGIYNSDVSVGVQVIDPQDASAGIKEVTYEVYNLGEVTQRGVLYHFDNSNPKHSELVNEVSSRIVVESAKNNSNNVIVKVNVVDNAGNISSESKTIMIDITKPAISVSYDNNNGETSFGNKVYFKENRTATISIVERNFNPNLVNLSITNEHGTVPQLSGWTLSSSGSGNGDGTTYTARVVFAEDGDYTFDISCTDLVGNPQSGVTYNNALAPQTFTVDKTAPVIEVLYDNNDVENGEYYKAERVATVRIREHNFETSRIQTEIKATHDGITVQPPTISNWSSSGDVHTATVRYSGDALYKFNISYVDMAGNQANEFAEQSFYVDKTLPEVEISGIVNESANNSTGNIGFIISAYDVNFDQFVPVVEVTYMVDGKLVTKKITNEVGEFTDVKNGKLYTVNNLETDGIYTIKCTVVDKAGNAFTQVSMQNKNGTFDTQEVTADKELVLFSVNRNGSTYNMNSATKELVQTYYVKYVGNDVVIEEINSDELQEYSITLNGQKLVENQDYTVSIEGSKGEWMKYTYTIKKSLFDKEGEYRIVVSSKDKAGNNAYNDVKGTNIDFVVDRTAPVVTVTGLSKNGRYQVDKQLVTIMPSDDGGALKSVLVRLVDENGNVIRELLSLSGAELDKALADGAGKLTFEIEEGLYQNVEILCEDYSVGDADSGSNEYTEVFSNVSVSTSRIKILWANKTLRYFVFGGVGVMAGFFFLILFKRRKKKDEKQA